MQQCVWGNWFCFHRGVNEKQFLEVKGIAKAGNTKAICDVKINIHFKYNFVALWRPFQNYSNFIFSKKQLSNIEPQITSSKEKKKKRLCFFFSFSPRKGLANLLLQILTLLKESLLTWIIPPEVEISENKVSKDHMKNSLQSSGNDFLLQKPFHSLREKRRNNCLWPRERWEGL